MKIHDVVPPDAPYGVRLRVYEPETTDPGPALLWMHGGAFIGGSIDMPEGDAVCKALTNRGIRCVSVDYRLAPGYAPRRSPREDDVRFPLPLDDCELGWRYLVANAEQLGARGLYVGGASAGGVLAASLCLRQRGGTATPSGAVLAYPGLHPEIPPFSPELRHALRGWRRIGTFTRSMKRWIAHNYVGRDHLERLPQAFPGGADLTDFPPTLIVNSERDTLRASGELFADELRAHDRPVQALYEPGTRHGHLNSPDKDTFDRSIDTITEWLRKPTETS
ncbi:alpha/beta hydrolase [Nocardia sp. NPDC004123]